jgi:hypothetical protein
MTFKEIERDAGKAKNGAIYEIVASARTNADDTVWTDKAAPICLWEHIALASISDHLASGNYPKAVTGWFERRGIRF